MGINIQPKDQTPNLMGKQGMPYPGLDGHQLRTVDSSGSPENVVSEGWPSISTDLRTLHAQAMRNTYGINQKTSEKVNVSEDCVTPAKINVSFVDAAAGRNEGNVGETSQSTKEETQLSSIAAQALKAEVREIVQKKFSANHAALGINPTTQAQAEKTDVAAALSESVIDLVTQSTNLG